MLLDGAEDLLLEESVLVAPVCSQQRSTIRRGQQSQPKPTVAALTPVVGFRADAGAGVADAIR